MTGQVGSPRWGTATKSLVALLAMTLISALLLRFHAIIPLMVSAGILAFLLVPVVRQVNERTPLSWALATNLSYLVFVLLLLGLSTAAGLAVIQQLSGVFATLQRILIGLPGQLEQLSQQPRVFGPWQLDLSRLDLGLLAEQTLSGLQAIFGQLSSLFRSLATVAIESVGRLVFVLAVAYFLTLDYHRIKAAWQAISIPGYEEDLSRLRRALGRIWHSFLRGQLLIVAVTGVLTWLLMMGLGVRFAVGLGVLGGLAKFVPILGPVSAGALAAIVALFQPSNWFGLTPLAHAGLVILCVVILDQSIDYFLLPRIMGTSLNLHPVIILIGAIIGASLAGIVGLLLSAPAVATLFLLARYSFRKMVDLPPWDPPIDSVPETSRAPFLWIRRWARKADEPQEV